MSSNRKWFPAVLVALVMFVGCSAAADCQDISPTETFENGAVVVEAAADDGFHRAVIKSAIAQVRAGKMRRAELIRLRVAMLSPSFREHAKELAIVQMAASGSENLPMTETGAIDEAAIDWEGLGAFIEKLIPLILKLIEAIAGMGL